MSNTLNNNNCLSLDIISNKKNRYSLNNEFLTINFAKFEN